MNQPVQPLNASDRTNFESNLSLHGSRFSIAAAFLGVINLPSYIIVALSGIYGRENMVATLAAVAFIGLAGAVSGILGLREISKKPGMPGKVRSWIGIIIGSVTGIYWLYCLIHGLIN